MIPPELRELTPSFYSSDSQNASEELVGTHYPQVAFCPKSVCYLFYLMKSVSRSWSRLTNDFIVR
jgi:hypothetical protein